MSDYVRQKVIRLPFPKDVLKKCNTDDPYDCEDYLKEKLGDLYGWGIKKFEIECTDEGQYLDYVYYHTYGEEGSNFGFVSYLTENEIKIIKPLFLKVTESFKDSDLRKVDYCYYNCSECQDYYDIKEHNPELTEQDLLT